MAEFKLTVKHPELPEGTPLDIDGVGVVNNGDSVTVTQEMSDAYANANDGLDLKKALAQNGALDFQGKDKLVDQALPLEELENPEVAETQAAKNEGGGK